VIFVDTGILVAAFSRFDPEHSWARAFLFAPKDSLATSDYVIDETLTLLRSRGRKQAALRAGEELFGGTLLRLVYLELADIREAWQIFAGFRDKDWSFTDCTSYVVMRRLGITEAAAFDEHFRQFGFVAVVP
jgi:predicted nucleic acid-binding protein